MITSSGNAGVGSAPGGFNAATLGDLVSASYAGAPPMDLYPASGGALIGAGDTSWVTDDDFNGTARGGVSDVGAYKFAAGGNPGWMLMSGFKGTAPVPPIDAGIEADATIADVPNDTDAIANDTGADAGARDFGPSDSDASHPDSGPADAARRDTGVVVDEAEDEGCGCTTSSGIETTASSLVLAMLVLARGRRR
jgi:hypothetical protein